MKNIFLTISIALFTVIAFAQNGKVSIANTSVEQYRATGDNSHLVTAKEAIDEASNHEKTSTKPRTWFIRGEVHQFMGQDSLLSLTDNDFFMEALESYEKIDELLEGKTFYLQDDLKIRVIQLGADFFNAALAFTKKKDYDKAYDYFNAVERVAKLAEIYEAQLTFDANIAKEESIRMLVLADRGEEVMDQLDKAVYFDLIADGYFKSGNYEKSKMITNKGLAKFPGDANLYINLINIANQEGNLTSVMDELDALIEKEPTNDQLLFIKAKAFDDADDFENAETFYKKTIEVNPENMSATYNLGALYYLKTNEFIEEMNGLGLSAADTKKYNELNAKRKEYYLLALPYFEKVLEVKPDDSQAKGAKERIDGFLKK